MYRGLAGINDLNLRFQTEWDQKLDQIEIGKKLFRVGDKVMQTKNNYRLEVFNGMVGRVVEIEGKAVTVDYGQQDEDERFLVEYDEKSIGELTLAYAASVHKYQGSQVPVVILVLSPSHWFMQYRSLIYTAVTRAQRLLIVVGDLRKAWTRFSTMKDQVRNTTLALRIEEAFGD
jgi:exodeoxyribonuclease V alpha subunit